MQLSGMADATSFTRVRDRNTEVGGANDQHMDMDRQEADEAMRRVEI